MGSKMIAKKIVQLRKAHNLTIEDLARISGYSKQYIREVEKGRREPSYAFLEKVSVYCNVDLDYFRDSEAGKSSFDFTDFQFFQGAQKAAAKPGQEARGERGEPRLKGKKGTEPSTEAAAQSALIGKTEAAELAGGKAASEEKTVSTTEAGATQAEASVTASSHHYEAALLDRTPLPWDVAKKYWSPRRTETPATDAEVEEEAAEKEEAAAVETHAEEEPEGETEEPHGEQPEAPPAEEPVQPQPTAPEETLEDRFASVEAPEEAAESPSTQPNSVLEAIEKDLFREIPEGKGPGAGATTAKAPEAKAAGAKPSSRKLLNRLIGLIAELVQAKLLSWNDVLEAVLRERNRR
jgi:transcriptional regulator with XRE-family HTH domain